MVWLKNQVNPKTTYFSTILRNIFGSFYTKIKLIGKIKLILKKLLFFHFSFSLQIISILSKTLFLWRGALNLQTRFMWLKGHGDIHRCNFTIAMLFWGSDMWVSSTFSTPTLSTSYAYLPTYLGISRSIYVYVAFELKKCALTSSNRTGLVICCTSSDLLL